MAIPDAEATFFYPGSAPVNFVDIPFSPDPNAMADNAVEWLRNAWEDWEPDDADPEVVLIEAIAPMAAETESQAAQMPAEALRTAGSVLYGITYDAGSPAQTTVTLEFVDGNGYRVPAGAQMNIDGYAFNLLADAVIASDAGTGPFELTGVPVSCSVYTAGANGLTGAIAVSLDLPAFVSGITVEAPTSDGTDPMDDMAFLMKVVTKLRLRADTLITARDFALEATLQPGIGFAWAVGNTARMITVTIADPNAQPVPQSVKDALNAIYSDPSVRSINVDYVIEDPTYTTVNVTYAVVAASGQDSPSLITMIDDLLTTMFSPASASKDGQGVIYHNVVLSRIGALTGVYRVESLTLSSPTAGASVNSSGDLLMAGGVAALPEPGTFNGTVDS